MATAKKPAKKAAPKRIVTKKAAPVKTRAKKSYVGLDEIEILDNIQLPAAYRNGTRDIWGNTFSNVAPGQCVQVPIGRKGAALAGLNKQRKAYPSQNWVYAPDGKYFRIWRQEDTQTPKTR
jgi:hypothetical protein